MVWYRLRMDGWIAYDIMKDALQWQSRPKIQIKRGPDCVGHWQDFMPKWQAAILVQAVNPDNRKDSKHRELYTQKRHQTCKMLVFLL